MASGESSFSRDLFIVVILSAISAWSVAAYGLRSTVPNAFWISLFFMAIVTLVVYRVLLAANGKRPQIFVAYFMGSLTVKLLGSLGFLMLIGIFDRENFPFTALGFFIVYALLTVVELRHLLPIVRNKQH